MVEDIATHKEQAAAILSKHEALRSKIGEHSPSHGRRLSGDLQRLGDEAEDQLRKVQEAVELQEQYDSQVEHLSILVSHAQEKLQATSVAASDVEGLKRQIAEHNVCCPCRVTHAWILTKS